MNQPILLRDTFGPRVADGAAAYSFRVAAIEPVLAAGEQVVLDFRGVRSANSSFINALVSGLFEQHGEEALRKLVFKGCLPTIQILIQAAVDLGITKHSERV